jgi:hypothetical protein
MGEIIYQGTSPYRVTPAQPSSARVGYRSVEMTVYASVPGKPVDAVQIQVPMPCEDARQLASQLLACAQEAEKRKH